MKIYITFPKKIIAVAAFILIVIAVAVRITAAVNSEKNADTEQKRAAIIENIGVSVEENPSVKEICVPSEFSDVYKNYNALQIKAGFDLSEYRGRNAIIYTYKEKGTDRIVNLIVCDGELIGGDITETALSGEMKPLIKE